MLLWIEHHQAMAIWTISCLIMTALTVYLMRQFRACRTGNFSFLAIIHPLNFSVGAPYVKWPSRWSAIWRYALCLLPFVNTVLLLTLAVFLVLQSISDLLQWLEQGLGPINRRP